MLILGIAGFIHAFLTPKTEGFAVPDPAAEKELVTA
jgi:hypothetical protein